MKRIAVEEHFTTPETLAHFKPPVPMQLQSQGRDTGGKQESFTAAGSLDDIENRLKDMDEAGIDMQVLSLGPGTEQYDAALAISLARSTNDKLAKVVRQYPDRFAGLATIALQDPAVAADELERAVEELGLVGVLIKSHINGERLDDPKYWVVLERAEKLNVPIYVHPRDPSSDMIKPYTTYPELTGAMWGFAAEVGLHAMRLICSGVFDKYPGLKIILGHMGEALPYWLWRIDSKGPGQNSNLMKKPSEYVKDNIFISTSGMFFQPALLCAHLALGADNILFAVDYPAESNQEGVKFMDAAPVCPGDKEKIYHLNAERLFGLQLK